MLICPMYTRRVWAAYHRGRASELFLDFWFEHHWETSGGAAHAPVRRRGKAELTRCMAAAQDGARLGSRPQTRSPSPHKKWYGRETPSLSQRRVLGGCSIIKLPTQREGIRPMREYRREFSGPRVLAGLLLDLPGTWRLR